MRTAWLSSPGPGLPPRTSGVPGLALVALSWAAPHLQDHGSARCPHPTSGQLALACTSNTASWRSLPTLWEPAPTPNPLPSPLDHWKHLRSDNTLALPSAGSLSHTRDTVTLEKPHAKQACSHITGGGAQWHDSCGGNSVLSIRLPTQRSLGPAVILGVHICVMIRQHCL